MMSRRYLLKNALCLVTMDDARQELKNGWIVTEGRQIVALGGMEDPHPPADDVLDMSGHVVMPGMVNTHHHMYQSLTRVIPQAQDASLFQWLQTLYPIWARLTPDMVKASTRTAMAELLMSGCTTTSDHLYLFPNGCRLDDEIEAGLEMGMRFHACRGSMSVGESAGGLPPDSLVEKEADILRDTLRVIETYHDPEPLAMLTVGGAPCSPFSVSRELMRDMAELARTTGTRLHTHLAENQHDVAYSKERFGQTPAEYAEDVGWVGADVWHAHCVKLDAAGMARFGRTGTGIAHCPCSNMRLASGIAPIWSMQKQGVPVGLGVDGSASNDGASILAEARQAMLVSRLLSAQDEQAMMLKARDVLTLATRGGARILGRTDIGQLTVGKAADIIAFDMRKLEYTGALSDPVAALVFCTPSSVAFSMVNGKVLIQDGHFTKLDVNMVIEQHNRLAQKLYEGS